MKKNKVLITTTTPYMIKQFLMNDIRMLKELGYEVEVATNFSTFGVISQEVLDQFKVTLEEGNVIIHNICFTRSIFEVNKFYKIINQLKKLMNNEQYSLIHTHTPIAAFLTRIAYSKSNIYENCKLIYTAHGFHFFKGNSLFKNFIFKNIEKYVAKFTDVLITINQEDYQAAKTFTLKMNGRVEYVPGIGINIDKISKIEGNKEKLCGELKISDESLLILSVGELNENKNHVVVINALKDLPINYHYIICGTGKLKNELVSSAQSFGVSDRVHLLGYRTDVICIMKSCDLFVFPSKREGLSVALMEAMASGLPCVASNIRGNRDLIHNNENGILISNNNSEEWGASIRKIIGVLNKEELIKNSKEVIKDYDVKVVRKQMRQIYEGIMGEI